MSRAKMTEISPKDLDLLVRAFSPKKENRADFARACGATPNAAGFWFRDGELPLNRLKNAAKELQRRIEGKAELSKDEKDAKAFLEKICGDVPLEVLAAEALSTDKRSAFYESGANRHSLGHYYTPQSDTMFAVLTTEQLVAELSRRGWEVILKPAKKKKKE